MAKRNPFRKKPREAVRNHSYPSLIRIQDGVAEIAGEAAPGTPSFMTFLSQPQLYPFILEAYPEHIFWRYFTEDMFFGIAPQEVQELQSTGWESVGPERDAALEMAIHMSTGELPEAMQKQIVREPAGQREEAILYAHSQLGRTVFAHEQGTTTGKTWIEGAQLQAAIEHPVLLTYMMPKAAALTMHQSEIVIGTHALIEIEKEHRVFVYHIDQLGDAGDHYWQEMHLAPYPMRASADNLTANLDRVNLHVEINSTRYDRAAYAARKLAECYWQLHQHTLANPPALPALPNIFENATIVSMSPPPAVSTSLDAFSHGRSNPARWGKPTETPAFLRQDGKNRVRVEYHAPDAPDTLLWQRIRAFSDLDGDLLLALLAQWVVSPRDYQDYIWITAEHLLHYRGVLPRRYVAADGARRTYQYRYNELRAISASIENLRNTYATVLQFATKPEPEGKRKQGRPRQTERTVESYLIQISDFVQQSRLFQDDGETIPQKIAVAWRYRLGIVITQFLQDKERFQVAAQLQQVLSYDPVREFWEKRLLRFFLFNEGRTLRIGHLFEQLGLPHDPARPERARQHFEKALARLIKDGQLLTWSYQQNIAALPSKKWGERWLDYQIHIHLKGDPRQKEGKDG